MAPVLAFALERDGNNIKLTPAGDRATGFTMSKPYYEAGIINYLSTYLDPDRYGKGQLTHLTLHPTEDGKSYVADTTLASTITGGYISVDKKDLQIESQMYHQADLAAVFLLNIVGRNNATRVAENLPNPTNPNKRNNKILDHNFIRQFCDTI